VLEHFGDGAPLVFHLDLNLYRDPYRYSWENWTLIILSIECFFFFYYKSSSCVIHGVYYAQYYSMLFKFNVWFMLNFCVRSITRHRFQHNFGFLIKSKCIYKIVLFASLIMRKVVLGARLNQTKMTAGRIIAEFVNRIILLVLIVYLINLIWFRSNQQHMGEFVNLALFERIFFKLMFSNSGPWFYLRTKLGFYCFLCLIIL